MPEQGDIVLIPIPFTDLTSQKRRPVIVISNDTYNRTTADVIVVAMTSTAPRGRFSFVIESTDLVEGKLNRPGTVRVDRLFTVAQSIIVKRFGRVGAPVLETIRLRLTELTRGP